MSSLKSSKFISRILSLGIKGLFCFSLFLMSPVNAELAFNINAEQPIAITNIKVITMLDQQVLADQTLLIKEGKIIAMDNSLNVEITEEYEVLDGEGLYLSPGLSDSHTHLGAEVGVAGGIGENQALVYLANGVTTIINQGDFLSPFGQGLMSLRDRIDNNLLPGPRIYTASYARGSRDTGAPGQILTTFDDGVSHVSRSAAAGYDFIKIYNYTPNAAVDGIFSEARSRNMAVLGHFPVGLNAVDTLEMGLNMVSHSAAYYWQFFKFQTNGELIDDALGMTLDNNAYVSTTLFIEETIPAIWGGNTEAFESFISQDEMRFAHPEEIEVWRRGAEGARWNPSGSRPGDLDIGRDFIRSYIKTFFDAGVKFVAGTDSPTVLGAPGFSTHNELNSISRLGVSNYDTLATATINMGDFINENIADSDVFGRIIVGARADFILTASNPLDDLSALQSRSGVMANGNWYSDEFLQIELEKVAVIYSNYGDTHFPASKSGGGVLAYFLVLIAMLLAFRWIEIKTVFSSKN